jgi:hypothetical protein
MARSPPPFGAGKPKAFWIVQTLPLVVTSQGGGVCDGDSHVRLLTPD